MGDSVDSGDIINDDNDAIDKDNDNDSWTSHID